MFDIRLVFAGIKAAKEMVVEGIETLDQVMPDSGQGQAKLNILKGWVTAFLEAEVKYAPVANWIWSFLVPIITAICAKRKAAGA